MSKHDRQHFVAYRSLSDQFEIRFFGGPLDGANIRTDIYPDSASFVHRVRNRNYVYRYKQISKYRFDAHLNVYASADRVEEAIGNLQFRLWHLLILLTLCGVLFAAVRVMGVWPLLLILLGVGGPLLIAGGLVLVMLTFSRFVEWESRQDDDV